MADKKLPNATAIYFLSLFSYFIICFGGIGLLPAVIAFVLAKKSEKMGMPKPEEYSNFGKIKKGKIMSIIGIILNLVIVGITIWTLVTIGWDAWSEEFVRKWNQGLEDGGY